jgi:hypothetical protein
MKQDRSATSKEIQVNVNKHELETEEKQKLEESIRDFRGWLCKRLHLDSADRHAKVTFPRPSSSDWIMRWKGDEVQFNTYITTECTPHFFEMIALHEFFHLFVQGVPNKSDAKRIKDGFGNNFMTFVDIEADYFTALYYKEIKHASLVDVFCLYHEAATIFGDPNIRPPKLERFIGSILSIANAYLKCPAPRHASKEHDLYLPTNSNLLTEGQIHVLIRRDYFALGEIQVEIGEFLKVRDCYTGKDSRGPRQYVETLVRFAARALDLEVPRSIWSQIYRLPTENAGLRIVAG